MTTSQVSESFTHTSACSSRAEEFNKYLGYVRNLGFEDTPDYDYLRDLFTQALKNTGEVEDGEYDWTKLNNGKGWESTPQPKLMYGHLHHPNAVANTSARDIHGTRMSKNPVPPGRLDAELPKPGATRISPGQGAGRHPTRKEPGQYQSDMIKRKSVPELAPPDGSTGTPFPSSTQNLPRRTSTAQSPMGVNQQAAQGGARGLNEPKPTFFQKLGKCLCCGE